MSLSRDLVDSLEKRLIEEREQLLSALSETNRFGLGSQMRESIGELSLVDNHPADTGDELFERSKDLALRDHTSLRLERIEHALNRISQGTYGTCAECGTAISYARLEAEPAADLCVECRERQDANEITTNRPVEENFLFPSFGRTDLDTDTTREIENNGYDGEDAWQDVAKYGTSNSFSDGYRVSDQDELYIESDEPIGYVEDIEGFLTADMYGNPTGFTRNAAYYRNWHEQDLQDEENDFE